MKQAARSDIGSEDRSDRQRGAGSPSGLLRKGLARLSGFEGWKEGMRGQNQSVQPELSGGLLGPASPHNRSPAGAWSPWRRCLASL